tara:strand:- start:244 stop:582 length:339 start_codon:yes stop_codon:yes gene_type:complete
MGVITASAVGATIAFIGTLVSTEMQASAAASAAEKRQAAAKKQSAMQQAEMSRPKFTPREVAPAPPASRTPQIGGGSRLPVDTGPVQLSSLSQPRITAAERLKKRLQSRRTV